SSENVENHQQKDGETSQAQEQAQPHDKQQTLNHKQTSVLDDLDKIKQDTSLDEDADTTQKQKRSDSSSNQRQDRQQDSKNQSQSNTRELPHSNAKEQQTLDDLKHIADEADVKQSDQ
ncbi:cell wall anchor protein, partial [Vibrio vulnificus]